jgi:hypothetical protein
MENPIFQSLIFAQMPSTFCSDKTLVGCNLESCFKFCFCAVSIWKRGNFVLNKGRRRGKCTLWAHLHSNGIFIGLSEEGCLVVRICPRKSVFVEGSLLEISFMTCI